MSQKEYLDLLRYYLRKLPDNVVEDIIADYEEHFRLGKEAGKSEGMISAELGSPIEIARDFKASEYQFASKEPEKTSSGSPGVRILLIVLGLLVLSPVILTVLSLVFALFATVLSLIVAAVISFFAIGSSLFLKGLGFATPWVHLNVSLHPLTQVLTSLACLCLGLLAVIILLYFIKFIYSICKRIFVAIRWEIKKRRARR